MAQTTRIQVTDEMVMAGIAIYEEWRAHNYFPEDWAPSEDRVKQIVRAIMEIAAGQEVLSCIHSQEEEQRDRPF